MRGILRSSAINAFVLVLSVVVCLLVIDWALGAAVLLRWYVPPLAHPAEMSERRRGLEFDYQFQTNNIGFRDDDIEIIPSVDSDRILVVGDSFVEGWGVDQASTFTALLETSFQSTSRKVDFINAGLSGQGVDKYADIIENFAPLLDVEGVLLCIFANDLWDMDPERLDVPLHRYMKSLLPNVTSLLERVADSLEARGNSADPERNIDIVQRVVRQARKAGLSQEAIDVWQSRLRPEWVDAASHRLLSAPILSFGLLHPEFWLDSIEVESVEARHKWLRMEARLRDIETFLRKRDIDLAVVYIPSVFQYDPESHSMDRPWPALGASISRDWLTSTARISDLLVQHFRESGTPFYDLTDALRRSIQSGNEPLNFNLDEHLNERGHRVVADLLRTWLVAEQPLEVLDDGAPIRSRATHAASIDDAIDDADQPSGAR